MSFLRREKRKVIKRFLILLVKNKTHTKQNSEIFSRIEKRHPQENLK